MPTRDIQYAMAAGEVSELFTGRGDLERYQSGMDVVENWKVLPKGGLQTYEGTERVGSPTNANQPARFIRFGFNIEQTYVFGFGPGIVDIYRGGIVLRDPVTTNPVTLTTPYQADELFQIQVAQLADIMYLTHPNHPIARIVRLDEAEFRYEAAVFRPPPLFDQGEAPVGPTRAITLSATIGSNITADTAADVVFLEADIGRQLVVGTGRGVITGITLAGTRAIFDVISPFPSTGPFENTAIRREWFLEGHPNASIRASRATPVGDETILTLLKEQDTSAPNLIVNGTFADFSGWTIDPTSLFAAGIGDAGSSDTELQDATATFITNHVQVGHEVIEQGTGFLRDVVVQVTGETRLTTTSGGVPDWDGSTYEIRSTGRVRIAGDGKAELRGGTNGVGSIVQSVTVASGRVYRLKFSVLDGPVSLLFGGALTVLNEARGGERSYPVGDDHEVMFVAEAPGQVSIRFRNNQPSKGSVANVRLREESINGFRTETVGKLIAMRGGIVEITEVISAAVARGIIWADMEQAPETSTNHPGTDVVRPGAWVMGDKAWSAESGYPRAISFHDGRLWLASTRSQPLTAWGSVTGLFENFALGATDESSVDVELSSNELNEVQWIEPFRDLFFGTASDLTLVTGGNSFIAPARKGQVPQDAEGSAHVRPVRLGNRLFQLGRGRRKIRELTIDADTGLSDVFDLTQLSDHITESGIVQLAMQTEPFNILWAVRRDGQLVGYTMEIAEEVRGAHRRITDGQFESILVIPVHDPPNEATEEVWAVVNRSGTRHFEVFRPTDVRPGIRRARLTLDNATRYDGIPRTTIATHHAPGTIVTAVAREEVMEVSRRGSTRTVDRLINLGEFTVDVNNQIFLPEPYTRVDVGLPFVCRAVTLPPDQETREGGTLDRRTHWNKVNVKVFETAGLTINGERVSQRDVDDLMDTYIPPRTGLLEGEGTDWDFENRIVIEQRDPFPATILSIIGHLDVEETE